MKYKIAYMRESGDWDIVREFSAGNNTEAEEYAESEYPGTDWYVLDANNNNINH